MGSRGSFFGKTNILISHEYRTVLRIGVIRLIEPVNSRKGASTPTMSRTARAVYATLRDDQTPKQITVYNKKREKLYDIDLDHDHSPNKDYPEGHVQYYKNGKRENANHRPNARQRKLIEQLINGMAEVEYGNPKINTRRGKS